MLGGVSLHQLHVVLALIVGALVHLPLHLLHVFFQLADVGKCLLGLGAHGGVVLQHHHLRQVAYYCIGGHGNRTLRGLLLSAENLEQRRLACTVLAHEGYPVASVDDEARSVEQGLHPKLHLESFY